MKTIVLIVIIVLTFSTVDAQIANDDRYLYELQEGQSTGDPDSVINLKNSCQLIYSSDMMFNRIYFKNQLEKIFVVDLRSPDERGSVVMKTDNVDYIIFEVVEPGIRSDPRLLKVMKETGKKVWVDK